MTSTTTAGAQEIVVGTNTGRLFVFDHDGTVRAGLGAGRQAARTEIASARRPASSTATRRWRSWSAAARRCRADDGRSTAFEADGTVKWRFAPFDHFPLDGLPDAVYSTPALGDLGGDGQRRRGLRHLRTAASRRSTATNGALLPGWPYDVRESIWSSPALADLNGDGQLKVIIGSDVQWDEVPSAQPPGGGVWVFRRNGSFFPGFPKFVSYTPQRPYVGIQSSPVVGDVTGDGCPDIVVGTGQPGSDTTTIGRLLHVYQRDGSIPPGWPKPLIGHVVGSPALAQPRRRRGAGDRRSGHQVRPRGRQRRPAGGMDLRLQRQRHGRSSHPSGPRPSPASAP